MSLLTRVLNVFRSKALEQEFDDELRFHLEARIATLRQQGLSRNDAEVAARKRFGSVDRVKQNMREVRMVNRQFVAGLMAGILTVGLPAAFLWRHSPQPPNLARQTGLYFPGEDGVTSPVLVRHQDAQYTPAALRAKVSGTIGMVCVVESDGTCDHIHLQRSLDPGLDQEAKKALQAWRFQPATKSGQPVPVLVTIEMAMHAPVEGLQ